MEKENRLETSYISADKKSFEFTSFSWVQSTIINQF